MTSITSESAHQTILFSRSECEADATAPPSESDFRLSLPLRHSLAGLTGGALSTSILHPLDLMKLRFAVNRELKSASLRQSLKTVWRQQGIRGIYQGMTANCLGAGLAWGTYFFCFNLYTSGNDEPQPLTAQIAVASQAGLVSHVVRSPLSVVKTRLCLQIPNDLKNLPSERYYNGIGDAFKKIYKYEGMGGFYKGFTPGLFGVFQGVIQIISYRSLKSAFEPSKENPSLSPLKYLICAVSSKLFSSILTYPYQVVRARMQDQHREWGGWRQIVNELARNEGVRGFYRGITPNMLHVLPNVCIVFLTYELLANYSPQ